MGHSRVHLQVAMTEACSRINKCAYGYPGVHTVHIKLACHNVNLNFMSKLVTQIQNEKHVNSDRAIRDA